MRFLYLIAIFLVGVTVLTFLASKLEDSNTSSPELLFGPDHDILASSQRFLKVHAAHEEEMTKVKDKPKEERTWWNELLYKFAWKCNRPDIAFRHIVHFAERNEDPKISTQFRDWFLRLVKFRARGKKFGDDRLYKLMTGLGVPKSQLVSVVTQLRSIHGLTEVADTMLGKLAFEAEMTEQVFEAWLQCKANPAHVFNSFTKLKVNDSRKYFTSLQPAIQVDADNELFRRWLQYVMAYMEVKLKPDDHGQYTKKELIDFLLKLKSAQDLVKVFDGLQQSRLSIVADEIMLALASRLQCKKWVYDAWLGFGKHPMVIFDRALNRKVGVSAEFKNWLDYVQFYREKIFTNNFNDDDLFHLLTDKKVNSNQAVVETFDLLSRNEKSTTKTAAEVMMAYMAVHAATTELVLKTWLVNGVNPRKVYYFRRLGKPEFDSDFMTQWLIYVKMFQAESKKTGLLHFDDYECVSLLRSKKSAPDLVPMLESLLEDPALNELANAALVDLKVSKSMDTWLAGNIKPGDVWAMLPSEVHVDSNNFIFRRWILYVDDFMKKGISGRDEELLTLTNLFYLVVNKGKNTVEEVVKLFQSLVNVQDTKEISMTMLKRMTTDPDLSMEVIKSWKDSKKDLYGYFRVFPSINTPEKTITAWFRFLKESENGIDYNEAFKSLCEQPILMKNINISKEYIAILLRRARAILDAENPAETLLKP